MQSQQSGMCRLDVWRGRGGGEEGKGEWEREGQGVRRKDMRTSSGLNGG